MDLAGFPRSLEHNAPAKSCALPIEPETHEVEVSASIHFDLAIALLVVDGDLFDVRETKDLPVPFKLKAEFGFKILGNTKSDLVQHFLI